MMLTSARACRGMPVVVASTMVTRLGQTRVVLDHGAVADRVAVRGAPQPEPAGDVRVRAVFVEHVAADEVLQLRGALALVRAGALVQPRIRVDQIGEVVQGDRFGHEDVPPHGVERARRISRARTWSGAWPGIGRNRERWWDDKGGPESMSSCAAERRP